MSDLSFKFVASTRAYTNCPVAVNVASDQLPAGPVEVVDQAGVACPAQVENSSEGPKLHWVIPWLGLGQSNTYTVRAAQSAGAGGVELRKTDDKVDVLINGEFFTAYVYDKKWARPFLHPLTGPSGSITRHYPMEEIEGETHDHPHHKGCWVAHGDLNGSDNWAEQEGHGTNVHREFVAIENGPVFARLAVKTDWFNSDGAKLLEEDREYRFYNQPTGARSFDLSTTFHAKNGDVNFGDTKEGGICSVRVATSMDVKRDGTGGRFVLGSGAIDEAEGWGKRAPWCDYTGPVNGQTVGVAIFDTPGNFRYPTYWHVRNYGLMTANPFGLSYFAGNPGGEPDGSHMLKSGQQLAFRYRVYVHSGNTEAARVGEQYHHYINPPTVETASE